MRPAPRRALRVALVGGFAALNFLPIVNWIPGRRVAVWYGDVAMDWVYGSLIAIGGGVVLAILSRRATALWRDGRWTGALDLVRRTPMDGLLLVTLLAFAAYLAAIWGIEGGRPIHLDEIMQVYQARLFASGSLTDAAFRAPEFFDQMFLVHHAGRVSGQFPPGGPAMLALGSLVHAEWLVQPVAGAVSVVAFGLLARRIEPRSNARLGAVALMALAPFMVFMAGSHMNHVAALMWLLIAAVALHATVLDEGRQAGPAFLGGVAFGIAATIRPGDALAFAAPAGLWLLWRALRPPYRWREVVAAGLGLAGPIALLLWANAGMTGSPFTFGYSAVWGPDQGLGFHSSPWGPGHTPLRGLEQVNLYFLKLQRYLFETPFPSVLPAILALALVPKIRAFDRYLLASGGLLVAVYFAYYHNGDFLGPRFVHPLIPVLALWTARLPAIVKERWGAGPVHRTVVYSYGIGALVALAVGVPLRAGAHAANLVGTRWDADQAAEEAGATNALVLVRESWGAQLLARMWALGITRPEAELLYGATDRCRLEEAVAVLEADSVRGAPAFAALLPEVRDSARLVRAPFSVDPTAKFLPNAVYTQTCLERIREEEAGFTVTLPLLLADGGGNVYARDLHARDTVLLDAFPGRSVFLLKPPTTELGARPRFMPLSRDSLRTAWGGGGGGE